MSNHELFLMFDVESDGPCPGLNSMLSLGAVIVDPRLEDDRCIISGFEVNFEAAPGAAPNPDTMAWWRSQPPAAWDAHRVNIEKPEDAMLAFVGWAALSPDLRDLGVRLVPVAWPAAFDWSFLNYYLWRFVGSNPLGYQCADVRSYFTGAAASRWLAGTEDSNTLRVLLDEHRPQPSESWRFPVTRIGDDGENYVFVPGRTHVALDDAALQAIQFARAVRTIQDPCLRPRPR